MKYYVLARHFDTDKPAKQFELQTFETDKSKDALWEDVELEMMNTNTQIWLMTEAEYYALLARLTS